MNRSIWWLRFFHRTGLTVSIAGVAVTLTAGLLSCVYKIEWQPLGIRMGVNKGDLWVQQFTSRDGSAESLESMRHEYSLVGLSYYSWRFANTCGPTIYSFRGLRCPVWMLTVAFGSLLVPCLMVKPSLRRRKRRMNGLCIKCGYNLTGNASGICPECGESCDADVSAT